LGIDDCRQVDEEYFVWKFVFYFRVFVMILVGISILWIPIIRAAQGSRLFDYIQAVQSFLAPPVAACYLLGVLWKRINEEVIYFKQKSLLISISGSILGFDSWFICWNRSFYLGIFLYGNALSTRTFR
jgi:hypothetical protein